MNSHGLIIFLRKTWKTKPSCVARAAVLFTRFLLGALGIFSTGEATLLATTPTIGTLDLSPTSISFGSVAVGSSHTTSVTIRNSGSASITISATSVSGSGFSVSGLTAPKTIAGGTYTIFTAKFAPTAAGSVSGSLKITSNARNSSVIYALSGTGTAVSPSISATPSSISFGNVPVGTTNTQTIQIKNISSQSVSITGTSLNVSGYHVSGLTVPLTLAAGATTHFNLAFTPSSAVLIKGTLTVNLNSPRPALPISISGTGTAATRSLSVSPTSLDFGSETVGKTHLIPVTLKNNGNSGLTISGITVSDTDFTTSGSVVGVTLAVGQSATLNVIFAPQTVAANTATVKVSSNAANSPATINVTGKGVSGTAHSVALTWGGSGSTGVTGYYLYRSTSSSSGYARLTASPLSGLQYTDGTVQSSTTYYYEVSAVSSSGIESTRSAPVSAAIP